MTNLGTLSDERDKKKITSRGCENALYLDQQYIKISRTDHGKRA